MIMLDRAKIIHQLRSVAHKLFSSTPGHLDYLYAIWDRIAQDPYFVQRISAAQAPWPLPLWQGALNATIPIDHQCSAYAALSADGSQIYPDRHQGTHCSLINIGSIAHDTIDCIRQEYECMAAAELAATYAASTTTIPRVFLFDGTLIFWQLEAKGSAYKNYFLPQYCSYLHIMAHHNMPLAGYISVPRSKELVNLIRFVLFQDGMGQEDANALVAHVTDSTLLKPWLPCYARTTVFESRSGICAEYPEHVRPFFWYLHVGAEIARIESCAWIATNETLVNQLSAMIIDQCIKGYGYPVVLAEAHEQAVIKKADRDFFYDYIRMMGFEHNRSIQPSQKSIKKRGLGI
jgi:hypothetical protein